MKFKQVENICALILYDKPHINKSTLHVCPLKLQSGTHALVRKCTTSTNTGSTYRYMYVSEACMQCLL